MDESTVFDRPKGLTTMSVTASQPFPDRPKILICDDQHDILAALELLLKMNGYQTQAVDFPDQLLKTAGEWPFDLILMDLNYTRDTTSGQEGLMLLQELRKKHSVAPIVVMTAWGNVELAVEAMRLGASDFIQKPWENSRLLHTLSKEIDRAAAALVAENRTKSELEIARHVQQKLFPQRLRPIRTLDYAGRCTPARAVGGDYYDFFDPGGEQLSGILADVSGKGVAAAMLMANLQASFRSQLESGTHQPAKLLETINRLFYESTPPEQYVTLFYFVYAPASRTLSYVNCGHPSPLIIRKSGQVDVIESTSTVLGLFPFWRSQSGTTNIGPGDTLIAFTDGFIECFLEDGAELGEEQFYAMTKSCLSLSARDTIERISQQTRTLCGSAEPTDDQTLLVLRGTE